MKLRNAFLSKMVVMAVVTGQVPMLALAQHEPPSNHKTYSSALTFEAIKKLEASILSNPHSAIDKIVHIANTSLSDADNGMKNFKITVKYSNALPAGETTYLELVSSDPTKVTMQLNVHEAAKTNPFFFLEGLVEMRNLYDLDLINAYETKTVYGHKHPNHHHAPIVDYQYINMNLNKNLGFPTPEVAHMKEDWQQKLTPMEFIEVQSNASAGSAFAQRRLQELKNNNFILVKRGLESFLPIKNLSPENKKKYLSEYAMAKGITPSGNDSYEVTLKKLIDVIDLRDKQKIDALNGLAKKTYQQQVNRYKEGAGLREMIVQGPALNEMIKANDREGVAKAMEVMLPWDIMEPTEKVFWSDFVEAVRRPNYTNAQILFRGIDAEEKFQAVTDAKGNVVSGGLLSKRLTAGSGSHLFKLKGLPETFETFGTNGVRDKKRISPLTQPHTLTKMMLNHAQNPAGSPFISLSYSLSTAFNFSSGKSIKSKNQADYEQQLAKHLKSNASGGVATIRIDPRRLLVNSVSGFTSEREVLASMFIFPDEVIYLEKGISLVAQIGEEYKYETRVTQEQYYARARAAVLAKTGIVLPETPVQDGNYKDFVGGLKAMETLFNRVAVDKTNRCERLFK